MMGERSEAAERPTGGSAAHHDAGAPVGLEELAAALAASQGVQGNWLQDRLDLFVIAGCTYAVRGLTIAFGCVKFIHERALFGAGKGIANGIGLKMVDATLFLIKLQQRSFHRHLLHLQPDQSIQQVRDKLLRCVGIDIGLVDHSLDVLRDVRRTLGEAEGAAADGKDGSNGF